MKYTFTLVVAILLLSVSMTKAQSGKTPSINLQNVINNYIIVKEALVQSSGDQTAEAAKTLLNSLDQVQKSDLSTSASIVWNKVVNDLKEDAEHISSTKEITHQRDHFMSLSQNMYAVAKASSLQSPLYYQFCPMANKGKGASWLSVENKIKNPYYGSKMLSCGKVTEVLQ